MTCSTPGGSFRRVALAAPFLSLFVVASASAALITHTPPIGSLPDVNTVHPDIVYDFTAGVGGTLTVNGRVDPASSYTNPGTDASFQTMTFPSGVGLTGGFSEYLYYDGTVQTDCTNSVNCGTAGDTNGYIYNALRRYTDYSLTANFDANGNFTGGTVSIYGYLSNAAVAAVNTYYGTNAWGDSGTILTGSLAQFGFSGTHTGTNSFDNLHAQFNFAVTGGDLFGLGYGLGSLNYDSVNVMLGLTPSDTTAAGSPLVTAGNPCGVAGGAASWDDLTCGGQQRAFMQDFVRYSTSGTLDTWVPIPGAVWLFGSGVVGLLGFARRKTTKR